MPAMSPSVAVNSSVAIAWLALVYCLSNIGGWVAPELIFELMGRHGFAEADAGTVSAVEMLGVAIAALGLSTCADRLPVRLLALAGAALLVVSQFLCAAAGDLPSLLVLRFLCGVGQGVLMALASAALANGFNPHSRLAQANLINVLFGAGLLYSLAPLREAFAGVSLFVLLGVVSLAMAPWALKLRLPAPVTASLAPTRRIGLPNLTCYVLVLAIFLFGSTSGAAFTFAHVMGENAGLSNDQINLGLSLSVLGALPGSALCGLINTRLRSFWPLSLALLLHALANLSASHATGFWSFCLGSSGSMAGAYFLLPYLQGLSARFDSLGGCCAAIAGGFFLSMACGAYFGGWLVQGYGVTALGWAVLACNLLVGALLLAVLAPRSTGSTAVGLSLGQGAA